MEKYGTIPKKFTKAWWEYFWEYYKWHTITIAFIIFMISSFAYSKLTATKYDLYMSYVAPGMISDDVKASMTELLAPVTDEITDNEQKDISYDMYSIDASKEPDPAEAEMESAVTMKLMAELQAGYSYLFIISKGNLESFYGLTDCLEDTSVYAGDNENVFRDQTGKACAISLKDNPKLSALGFNNPDLYLAVRSLYERDKDNEKNVKLYENSLKIAEFIVGE